MNWRVLFVAGVFVVSTLIVACPAWADDHLAASVTEGAADARTDFDHGVLMLLGEEGMEAGGHPIGNDLVLEVVPHACAPNLDPAAYMDAYNGTMKTLIREKYGIDIDSLPDSAFSQAQTRMLHEGLK